MIAHVVKVLVVAALVLVSTVVEPDAGVGSSTMIEPGLIQVRSARDVGATVARLRSEIEAKRIMLFAEVDQSGLAAQRGIALRPSVLLIFGNVTIGARFLSANPRAGLDWPVRLLVVEDEAGQVWVVYEDFAHMAERYGIRDRAGELATAARVVASIASTVTQP